MRSKKFVEAVGRLSHGLLKTGTDFLLFQLYFGLELFGSAHSYSGLEKAFISARRDLKELNFRTLEGAFNSLKRKGLLKVVKEELYFKPEITEAGLKRLKALLPFYDEKRVWDGRIYLVTYDIVEERKSDREKLRQTLLKLGCAKLQASVYLTPYNPTEVLRESLEKHGLQGSVLISNLGEDGSIGEEDFKELLARIYDLDVLNSEYGAFLEKYRRRVTSRREMVFEFLSILQSDPQLPFPLLPEDWLGEHAYRLLQNTLRWKVSA